ncbi:MAG: lytic transglycosylase domain-containing protein [Kiloniellaceae bacterium]
MTQHACKRVSVFLVILVLILATSMLVRAGRAADTLTDADRRLYTSALTLFEDGYFDLGISRARQGSHPLGNKIVDWLDYGRRNSGRSFNEISAFIQANPDWPGLFGLYRNAELLLPATFSPTEILTWFGDRPPITGKGALRNVAALWDSGQQDRARSTARQLWVDADFEPDEEGLFHTRFKVLLSPADEVARLQRLLWDRKAAAAQRQIQRVPADHAALARARLALIDNRPGVDALIERVPSGLRNDPGLIYERAVWRQRRGRHEGVVELLDILPPQMPQDTAWWRLRNWVVWRALDRNDYALAYRMSAQHGHVDGVPFADGEWQAGWVALKYLGQPEVAYGHFARLHDGVTSEISKSRGAFWAGEAASELGRAEEARRWYESAAAYPATFYGQLAGQRMGKEREPPAVALLVLPEAKRAAFEAKETVQAVRLLGQLEQSRLQDLFIARLRQDAKDLADYRLIVELANEQDRHDLALRTAKSARRDGHDLHPLLYPRRSLPIGPAPESALVLAVMRQESEFYPKARSPVGALGLMQLMPATARQTAQRMGLPFSRDRLTDDPDYNVRLGQAYLNELLEQFDGSYILALAAYNAGPTRARNWIGLFGDPRNPAVDPINWIERIPFSETRNYVQRILESLVVYRDGSPKEETRWALYLPPAGT